MLLAITEMPATATPASLTRRRPPCDPGRKGGDPEEPNAQQPQQQPTQNGPTDRPAHLPRR